ncbi:helix-turn-helix domain-containing protein [Clostridium neonatale]|uniref:helix-turn-helix domain-containing protein n=1 Tax=Clostridium neonatale TaxID=137838 RepID=UPI00291B3D18|nr:Helix-turn-helix domain protein [Clostridium neonatale]
MFNERLKNYRENHLKISTKKEMAEKLGVSEQLYAMVERGARNPSKDFLRKLVIYSNLPEEYWIYGVKTENEFIDKRKVFKSIESTVYDLIDDGTISDINFDSDVEDVLITALKADIQHILLKRKKQQG